MGLSIWHILLFALVVILLFGTAKLKNLGKDLGGAIKDFKDSINSDTKTEINNDQNLKDLPQLDLKKEKSH